MKTRQKTIALLAASLFSMNSLAQSVEEYCDFDSIGSDKVTISPMSPGNQNTARERFQSPLIYPHFFYTYDASKPVAEKTLAHREAMINGAEFYRVNEGTGKHPKLVRYYTTILEDCSKVYLRIDEQSNEFKDYWNNRASRTLSFEEFLRTQSEKLSILPEKSKKELMSLVNKPVTLTPMRNDEWYLRAEKGVAAPFYPAIDDKVKIKRLKKAPFLYMGRMISPTSIEVEFKDGARYWAPGHAHGLISWEDHQGVAVAVGVTESVVLANYGIPDRIVYLPLFKSPSGEIIIEDNILKDRLADGSGQYVPTIKRSEKIGSYKRMEFDRENGYLEVLFGLNNLVRSIKMR